LHFAVPNGGKRHIVVAKKLAEEGVRSGVPDLFIPVPSPTYNGLFLEVKTRIGTLSNTQKFWANELKLNNFKVVVVRSLEDAIEAWETYKRGIT